MGIEDLRIETAGMAIVRGKMVWIKSGGVDGLFRLLGTGSDRDIGSWDNFPDRFGPNLKSEKRAETANLAASH
jgi:hypothetical protein